MKAAAALYRSGKKFLIQANYDENHFLHDLQAPDAIGYCKILLCTHPLSISDKREIKFPSLRTYPTQIKTKYEERHGQNQICILQKFLPHGE